MEVVRLFTNNTHVRRITTQKKTYLKNTYDMLILNVDAKHFLSLHIHEENYTGHIYTHFKKTGFV